MVSYLRSTWTVFAKDFKVWLRQPVTIAASIVPSLILLLVQALASVAVGRSPVALVNLDNGPAATKLVAALEDANVFRLHQVSQAESARLMTAIDVVAVVTIPKGFSAAVAAGRPDSVDVHVNNLNLDFTNDIRRSVPDAITQYFTGLGSASPIRVTMDETDLRSRDIQLFQYSVVPTIVFLLMISALISAGIATAREWESRTVKELLLAPVPYASVISGKVLAGWLTSFVLGGVVMAIAAIAGWIYPSGICWLTAALVLALISLLGASLGVALGSAIRRIQSMIVVSILLTLYLFFLSGGLGVLAFEPPWLQSIASFVPLTYGIHALQMALYYDSAARLGLDAIVLIATSAAMIVLGTLSMRRKMFG